MKLLEKCANIAVIVGVAAFLFVIVRGELNKNKQSATSPSAGRQICNPARHAAQPAA